jgi:hypothetical protein
LLAVAGVERRDVDLVRRGRQVRQPVPAGDAAQLVGDRLGAVCCALFATGFVAGVTLPVGTARVTSEARTGLSLWTFGMV